MLANVKGMRLIDRTVASLREGGVDEVIVVIAKGDRSLSSVPDATVVENEDPTRGMLSSLQAGLRDHTADAIMVLPGDMPFVTPGTIRAVIDRFAESPGIISPRYLGKRGHPVVLPPELREEILAAEPTSTLHDVLRNHPDQRIDLEMNDRGVVRDVDTRKDLI